MAYELHANPDGLGWRAVIDWNAPPGVRRNLRFNDKTDAENAAKDRFFYKSQRCRVVEVP